MRAILIGPSGSGKSFIGNMIFGKNVFQTSGTPIGRTLQIKE